MVRKSSFGVFLFSTISGSEKGTVIIVLTEFEIALVHHTDLELTAQQLMRQADVQRNERKQEIEHDLRYAKLIQQALLEPTGSGIYSIAKAYLKQFQKRHNPHGDILAHQLKKEAENDQPRKGREETNHESINERTGQIAGVETTVTTGTGST